MKEYYYVKSLDNIDFSIYISAYENPGYHMMHVKEISLAHCNRFNIRGSAIATAQVSGVIELQAVIGLQIKLI